MASAPLARKYPQLSRCTRGPSVTVGCGAREVYCNPLKRLHPTGKLFANHPSRFNCRAKLIHGTSSGRLSYRIEQRLLPSQANKPSIVVAAVSVLSPCVRRSCRYGPLSSIGPELISEEQAAISGVDRRWKPICGKVLHPQHRFSPTDSTHVLPLTLSRPTTSLHGTCSVFTVKMAVKSGQLWIPLAFSPPLDAGVKEFPLGDSGSSSGFSLLTRRLVYDCGCSSFILHWRHGLRDIASALACLYPVGAQCRTRIPQEVRANAPAVPLVRACYGATRRACMIGSHNHELTT